MDWLNFDDPRVQAAALSAVVSAAVALLIAALNPFVQHRLNRRQAQMEKELERLKSQLTSDRDLQDARLSYEFDARKRLYAQVEPLIFQLIEACEESYARVTSLVRSQRLGGLAGQHDHGVNRLSTDGYYMVSTIYKIFLPHAVYQLLRRSATFVDLRLDRRISTAYSLMKISSVAMTDHFDFARLEPPLAYDPNVANWERERKLNPAEHWQQALHVGEFEKTVETMIVRDGEADRPISYGEFEHQLSSNPDFRRRMDAAFDLFRSFNFDDRPVLARLLLAHASVMHLAIISHADPKDVEELQDAVERFGSSDKAGADLGWDLTTYDSSLAGALQYVRDRLAWIDRSEHSAVG